MKELDRIEAPLSSAVSTTMENMTFEEIEFTDTQDRVTIADEELIWSALPIVKPYAGELVVKVSKTYGRVLAEEVAGFIDEDIPEAMVTDVLAEIANTIAGRFMEALIPEDQEFELGLPDTGNGDVGTVDGVAADIPLRIGEHSMIVSIRGDDFVELLDQAQEEQKT